MATATWNSIRLLRTDMGACIFDKPEPISAISIGG